MSLDKAIKHHKEYRKPYYGSQAIDKSCRCHGTCGVCAGNRQHRYDKKKLDQQQQLKELYDQESLIVSNDA